MKTAAIYCRVSTDNQETEGTSLQTQLEACRNYCHDKDHDVAYRFSEAYSGLTLERPKLNELRELIRNEQIDLVVVYCLDRLSRDPTHGVILTQELEKHNVTLDAVTETVDSSELGKLISYIRGFASKLEAEKIRERTMRGKRAKAKQGKLIGGGFASTYGYDYIRNDNENGGRRIINEAETKWVQQMYSWLVEDGMSTTAIMSRLRALNVPTKRKKTWGRQSVLRILKNPAYIGKTFAFTTTYGRPIFSRPKEEWIEIPGVTPKIIDEALFEAAQRQLEINRKNATRNTKREYLLHGHIYCHKCGRAYWAYIAKSRYKDTSYEGRRYRCSGSLKLVQPIGPCRNKSWDADRLEDIVWQQIEHVLDNPELIITEINKQHQDANQLDVLEAELKQVERHLKALDREQAQLLQWALKGFPEDQVVAENKRINQRRATLQAQKAEMEARIKTSQEAATTLPKLECFVELIREKLTTLDFETKRLALDMLNIKVLLDGNNVEITGTMPIPEEDDIVTTLSWQ